MLYRRQRMQRRTDYEQSEAFFSYYFLPLDERNELTRPLVDSKGPGYFTNQGMTVPTAPPSYPPHPRSNSGERSPGRSDENASARGSYAGNNNLSPPPRSPVPSRPSQEGNPANAWVEAQRKL
jgi:hypothetical protein